MVGKSIGVIAALIAVVAAARTPAVAVELRLGAGATALADTIRGTVFDSLTQQPLAGATIIAEPGGVTVSTDAMGRFTIASPEKIRRVAAFHVVLDQTGIGSLTATVDGATSGRVALATPSIATIWPRLCPGVPRSAQLGGILFGAARSADGTTRIAGAGVRVNWDAGVPSPATGVRQVDLRTDSLGSFYACGIPATENIYVVAYSAQFVSGVIALPGDSIPLRKQDIVLGRVVDSATARTAATGSLRGVVRDDRRRPVVNAAVDLDGLETATKTDSAGRFFFRNAPTGSRMLLVRAVGFTPVLQPVDVMERDGEELTIEVTRSFLLPGVRITERERAPLIRMEFERRRKMGFGVFQDSAALAKKFTLRSIFEGVPSLGIVGRTGREFQLYTVNALSGGKECPANVYIDERRTNTDELASLNKDWIVGVEIYVRQTTAPPEYRPFGNFCGIILVWTKQAFNR